MKAAAQVRNFIDEVSLLTYGIRPINEPHVSRERMPNGEVMLMARCDIVYNGSEQDKSDLLRVVTIADAFPESELMVEVVAFTADKKGNIVSEHVSESSGRFPDVGSIKVSNLKQGDIVVITYMKVLPSCKLIETPLIREW